MEVVSTKKTKKKTACNFQTMTMNSVVIPHDERPNGKLGIFANIKLFVVSWWQNCEEVT